MEARFRHFIKNNIGNCDFLSNNSENKSVPPPPNPLQNLILTNLNSLYNAILSQKVRITSFESFYLAIVTL